MDEITLDLSGSGMTIRSEGPSGVSDDPFLRNLDAAMSQYTRGNVRSAMLHLRDAGVFLCREHNINMPHIG